MIRSGRAWLVVAAILFAVLLLPGAPVRADGLFMKDRAFPVPPGIPAQRALIVHRDGVESLVVESSLDAAGQTFGWVLPIPARPTALEEVTSGALDTLDLATRPRVVTRDSLAELLIPAALALLLIAVLRRYEAARDRRRESGGPVKSGVLTVLLCLLAVLFAMVAIPNLHAGKLGIAGVEVAGVRASDAQRVGNYETVVLEARDGSALDAWLERNGLAPLPAAGVPVVADYISRGWVFVAARLAREGTGPATPHPLAVRFPAERPIYPMRLTALAGGRTDLRIHVVAGGSASCAPLEARFSGEFTDATVSPAGLSFPDPRPMLSHGPSWSARRIAHPGLLSRLWSGCVVTRLEGGMVSAAMDRDLVFDVGETVPGLHVLHTPEAAWRDALESVVWWWVVALLVLTVVPGRVLPALGGGPASAFLRWGLLLTVLGGAAVAAVRLSLQTVAATDIVRGVSPGGRDGAWRRLLAGTGGYGGKSLAEVRALVEDRVRDAGLRNPFTGRPAVRGDAPGDFDVIEDHRGPVLRLWSLEGATVDRAWHVARVEARIYPDSGSTPSSAGVEEAVRLLFPDGTFRGGVENPFTGAPMRLGPDPGDAEILLEKGKVVFRLRFRDGKFEDVSIP